MTRRQAALACTAAMTGFAAKIRATGVELLRVPESGLQPQVAVGEDGIVHLLYYSGDARQGNLFYTRSKDAGAAFGAPVRVNSQEGSAVAAGTIRGAQLALGSAGRVHVAWNGSMKAEPVGPVNPDAGKPGQPMLYARMDEHRATFEPQRNLMLQSFGLDGGGSVAADRDGRVFVAWHGVAESEAKGTGKEGEARRRVWITASQDGGRTFSPETKAWARETGACGCCGMKLFADRKGNLLALYRSATESVHRDVYLIESRDHGRTFEGGLLHKWEINACPMSSMDFAENGGVIAAAWETGGQVYWSRVSPRGESPVAAPGEGKGRKHPRLAVNRHGEVLLAWTEGTAWQKGGGFAWQIYDRDGRPTAESGRSPGILAWSFAAAFTRHDDSFGILY
jgi:hypothetical protein